MKSESEDLAGPLQACGDSLVPPGARLHPRSKAGDGGGGGRWGVIDNGVGSSVMGPGKSREGRR